MSYAEKLIEIRSRRKITQEALAKVLGVSFATINRWENGKSNPTKAAKASIDEIYGRPLSLDFSSVAKVLLRGLQRLAVMEEVRFESTGNLMERQLRNKARALCAGFDEVIAQARSEYLRRLDKLSSPNPVQVREQLRKDIDTIAREAREALRVISVKAEVLLQDAEELKVDLGADIVVQLQRISKIEAKSLSGVVELILGIVEETLDRFGIPLNS